MITIVFITFHSEQIIFEHLKEINNDYPVIIIENSLNLELKKELEHSYSNVKVIVPKKNLGFGAGMNLAIKESKTNYVFINAPDIVIKNKAIKDLVNSISLVENFSLLAPTQSNQFIHKNYFEKINAYEDKNFLEVDWIDNDFIINKLEFNESEIFDENIFMYFENHDLCKRIKDRNKKMIICKNIEFIHKGTQSSDPKFNFEITLSRNWHYSWSKYYFFKKHYGTIFALRKIFPNFIRSIKKIVIYSIFIRDYTKLQCALAELKGMFNSIISRPSSYRPFEKI
jgi:GT2 family glycosyltransferase